MAKTRSKPRPAWLAVADAARLAGVTTSAIYTKIKRGELTAKDVAGRRMVLRTEIVAYRKHLLALLRPPPKKRELTEAEFIRELIASDPD